MIEYIATSITLLISTIFMFFALIMGKKIIKDSKSISEPVLNITFFFAYYKVAAYYAMPAILNIFDDYDFVRQDNIQLFNMAYLYAIECVSWLPWLAAFIIVSRLVKKGTLFNADEIISHRSDTSKLLLTVWVLVYMGYTSFNIINILGEGVNSNSIYIEVFKALISYGGPPASTFLMLMGFRHWGKFFTIVGLMGFSFSIISISTRGMMVYSIIFLLYLVITFAPQRKYFFALGLILTLLLSTHLFLGGLVSNEFTLNDNGELSFDVGVRDKKGQRSALKEIEWRFGALTRYSTGFITMYERGDEAGINPIKNSLLGFVPRSLNPDKPQPSTRNGEDVYTQGMYLINKEIDGYTSGSMTEFSTGGHSYWELGWFGVITLNFISGLYIAICTFYFQRFGAISMPLMVTLFKPWGFVDPKIWVSDIVMQIYQIIIPIAVICFIIKIIDRWKIKRPLLSMK